ncbi:MAG TPA: carboxypeptidase-like regulatory domain-containing protein, partial [Ginsengibacter sp.]|nr:carboxypeptidase-like regulatory domain-containing protein [Ginsengibacter sp.]
MKIIQQAGLSLALLISVVSVQSQPLSKNTYGPMSGHQSGWTFGAGSGGAFGLKSGEAGLFRGNSFATKVFGSYYFGNVGLSGTTGVIGGAVDNGALHSFIKDRGMQPEDLSIHEAKPLNSFLMIGPSVRFGSRLLVNAGVQGGVFLNNPGSINVSNIGSTFPIYRIEGSGKNAFPGFSGNISLHYPLGNSFHIFLEGSYLQSRTTTNLTDPKNGIDMPILINRDLKMATAGIGITKSFGSSRSENKQKHIGKPHYGNLVRNDANSCGAVLLTITNPDGSVERLEFENPDGALAYYESRAAKLKAMKEGAAESNTSKAAAQGSEANESAGKVGYTLEYPDGSIERIVFACAADAAYYSARKGWDGSVKGNYKVTEETALRKGWDGSVKGNSITTEEAARKGWDGSVKGNSKVTEETALRKGWDGSVKGNSKVAEANKSRENKKRTDEEGYNPWEMDEEVEGTVMNPIRGSNDSAQSQRETGVILGNIFWGDGNLPGIETNQMAVSSKNKSKTETQMEDGVKIIFREAGDPSCADCGIIANASYSGKGSPLYQSLNNTHENPLYRGNKLGGNNPSGRQTNSKGVNPLYDKSDKSGDNPMFEPKGIGKNNPLYQGSSKGENPLYESNALRGQNGGICGTTSHFEIVLVSPVTGRQIARTTADECGSFWFTNVPVGKYGIRIYGNVISHEVYDVSFRNDNAQELSGHLLVSDRQLMVQLNTKFGESRQEGYVVMRGWSNMNGGVPENETGGHTTGNQRVAGQPIRGIIVKGGRNPPGQIQTVQTDDNGHFSFGNMAKGNYIITADIPFYVDEKVLIPLGNKQVWGDPHENLNGKQINEESKGSARGTAQDFNTTRSNRERGQDLATHPGGNNPSSADTGKSAIGQAQDFNTTRSNRERGQDLATHPGGNNPSSADTGKSAIGQAQDFNTTRSNRERGQDLATHPGGNNPSSADTGKSAIGQAQ